jgi:hypothetical protein
MNTVAPLALVTPAAAGKDRDETCEILSPEEIAEEIERLIYLRAGDLVEDWERADARDRWRHIGEQRPRTIEPPRAAPQPYRTPQSTKSTIDAFWYVASLDNPDYLKRWLAEHPSDVAALQKLWEAKHARP